MIDIDRFARSLLKLGTSLEIFKARILKGNRGTGGEAWLLYAFERDSSLPYIFNGAFNWDATPEGHEFWNNVYRRIEDVYRTTPVLRAELPVGKIARPKGRKYLCA
jgi:hypothetical protein